MRSLTERQARIMGLVADGLSNPEIADRLHISSNTVKSHLAIIFRTLSVDTRYEAIAVSIREGLIR